MVGQKSSKFGNIPNLESRVRPERVVTMSTSAEGIRHPTNHNTHLTTHFLLLASFSFLFLFVKAHQGDLSGYDDALYAHQGKEMVLTGNWWSIPYNGHYSFETPPVFIWLEAISMKLFGFIDFAAKFPVALLGFGTILLTYFITKELADSVWLPHFAMVVLMSTQYFMKYAGHAMTDVPYAFFFALAMFFYVKGLRNPRYLVLCGFPVALAVLTRSILGTLPVGIFLTHLVVSKRYELIRSRHLLTSLLIAVSLPLVWFVSQSHLHGIDFFTSHFSFISDKVSSSRFTDSWQTAFSTLKYPRLLLKLYWPWLPFMLIGLGIQVRAMIIRRDPLAGLLVIWVVGIILPLSLVESKVLRYIMPVFPAFAILSAIPLDRWISPAWRTTCFKILYSLGGVVLFYMILFPMTKLRAIDIRQLAPVAQSHTDRDRRILLYTYGELHWNYQNQLLWYTNRYTELVTDLDEVVEKLKSGQNRAVVMDRESFDTLVDQAGSDTPIEVLGRSESFVCFKSGVSKP